MKTEPMVAITPETRVLDLLTAYPEMEELLLEISPAFAKLKNPLLRRTVARVTSLGQAARVGGIPVGDLVNRIRRALGQNQFTGPLGSTAAERLGTRPDWCDPQRASRRMDVRSMIERGEKPVGPVLSVLRGLPPGGMCEVTAPFFPAPLVDLARGKGFQAWWDPAPHDPVVVYFLRETDGDPDALLSLES